MRWPFTARWARPDSWFPAARSAPACAFEALEPRELLAGDLPSVSSIVADNRGLVLISFTHDMRAASLTNASVIVTSAGTDGIFDTADDEEVSRTLTYDASARRLRVSASVPADARYKVRLDSSVIVDTNDRRLDGEFRGGSTISGDGVAGGDTVFYSRRAAQLVARFSSNLGVIDVNLFADRAPQTVANFQNYANRGVWDSTFFHRGVPNFVIQAGGFTNASGFASIPQDPPVQNEPGISNLRGTIAMAKLGGDPNSATNQWFFNLANNASNLDNQNGGFTVFGEIANASGLQVMDAIAALQTFNATAQNGNFTDVPVLDRPAVQARGSLLPTDTASFDRVSILVEVGSEPAQQISLEGAAVISTPASNARVTVLDLDGTGAPGNGSFLSVSFGRNGAISQIRITGSPTGRVGIVVSNATSIGSIIDARRPGSMGGEIAFILPQAPVGTIVMNSPLTGFNLNGFSLPGLTLPEDIDADGLVNDDLALLVPSGVVTNLQLRGGVGGDVLLRGGAVTVMVGGMTDGASFDLGTRGTAGSRGTSFTFHRVSNSSIRSADPITTLRAAEWIDSAAPADLITAPSLTTLNIIGDRASGAAGNFEASLTLSTAPANRAVLTNAVIAGDVIQSAWNTTGPLGTILIRGSTFDWSVNGATTVTSVRVTDLTQSRFTAQGEVGRFNARTWDKGAFGAPRVRSFQLSGDLGAEVLINGMDQTPVVRTFTVAGNSTGASVTIRGPLPMMSIAGQVRDFTLTQSNGAVGSLTFGPMTNSRVTTSNTNIDRFTAASFDGGELRANVLFDVNIRGNFSGDIRPTFLDRLTVTGDFTGTLNARIVNNVRIAGSMRNSTVAFTEAFTAQENSNEMFSVGGAIIGSEIRSTGSIGMIEADAMIDSGLFVGTPASMAGLPNAATGINREARVQSLMLLGSPAFPESMVNSNIVLGQLVNGTVRRPAEQNLGRIHGISVGDIRVLQLRTSAGDRLFNAVSTTPAPFGDFQLRLDFAAPAGA